MEIVLTNHLEYENPLTYTHARTRAHSSALNTIM